MNNPEPPPQTEALYRNTVIIMTLTIGVNAISILLEEHYSGHNDLFNAKLGTMFKSYSCDATNGTEHVNWYALNTRR